MYLLEGALLLLGATYVAAAASTASCPAVWQSVVSDLLTLFENEDFPGAQCGDNARAAVRAAFHDCAANNPAEGVIGCDGSLILTNEINENIFDDGLQDWANITQGIVKNRGVGAADLLQFAAAVAIRNCPEGPTIPTVIGRPDSFKASGNLQILDGTHNASEIIPFFNNMGLTAEEIGTLIGAHTSAEQCDFDLAAPEAPQDPTPQVFDVEIFTEIFQKSASAGVVRFTTDLSLSEDPRSGPLMHSFLNNAPRFHDYFVPAMVKMGKLGVDPKVLKEIDCTAFIPTTTAPTTKRVARAPNSRRKRSVLNPGCS